MQAIRKKQGIGNRTLNEKKNEKRVVHERKLHNPFLLVRKLYNPHSIYLRAIKYYEMKSA